MRGPVEKIDDHITGLNQEICNAKTDLTSRDRRAQSALRSLGQGEAWLPLLGKPKPFSPVVRNSKS